MLVAEDLQVDIVVLLLLEHGHVGTVARTIRVERSEAAWRLALDARSARFVAQGALELETFLIDAGGVDDVKPVGIEDCRTRSKGAHVTGWRKTAGGVRGLETGNAQSAPGIQRAQTI